MRWGALPRSYDHAFAWSGVDGVARFEGAVDANEAGSRTRGYAISLDVTQCGGYSGG